MGKAVFIIYLLKMKMKQTYLKVRKLFHKKKVIGEYITPDDTVDSILEHPVLKAEKIHIYEKNKTNDIMAIQTLQKYTFGFSKSTGQSCADGLNTIIRNHRSKVTVHRQLYSEEEIKKDPTKAHASLYYFPAEKKSKFVIVCPGGAYLNCETLSEGYPLAVKLNELGYTAFVLSYRIKEEAVNLAPLDDLAAAVNYIIDRADELKVDPADYAVMGFSAGGHLVGCFGLDTVGYKNFHLPKPGTIIMSYGLISTIQFTFCNKTLLGTEAKDEAITSISIDKNITNDYPPIFFWAGKDDILLDYHIHGDELERALKDKGVPYEYHLFDKAQHGISLGIGTSAEGWLLKAVGFWERKTANSGR